MYIKHFLIAGYKVHNPKLQPFNNRQSTRSISVLKKHLLFLEKRRCLKIIPMIKREKN